MFPFLCSGGSAAPIYNLVQTASGVGSDATATATFGSTPTVGNLMVAHYFTRATTATPPAGWTQAVQSFNATENDSVNVYYRIVQSGDGTGYTWGDGTDDELVRISEWSSSTGWPANPVDKTATTGRTTATSSLSSGTTATTTQADELSIAAVGLRNIVANTPNYTNSFTGQTLVTGGTNTSTLFPAYKIETATGAKETTVSWSGGAETAIGCIAVFKGN